MATTSSQVKRTYQTALSTDKEKKEPRHGLACEYLAFWMLENIVLSHYSSEYGHLTEEVIYGIIADNYSRNEFALSDYISRPIRDEIRNNKYNRSTIKGYADVLFGKATTQYFLGEVKIYPQSAEEILQQIKFYHSCIPCKQTIIALDFDCPQLARIVEGTNISVVRLGEKFEMFVNSRNTPQILEI
jgi:hypothetical protein